MERVWIYLVKRIVSLVVVIFLIMNLVFLQFFVMPGDPVQTLVPKSSAEFRQLIIEDLKLDEPLPVQYENFLAKVFSGKFFLSTGKWKGAPIGEGIRTPLVNTIVMFAGVLVAAGVMGGFLGLFTSRRRQNALASKTARLIALGSFAFPATILALAIMASFYSIGGMPVLAILSAFLVSWGALVLMEKGKELYLDGTGNALENRRRARTGLLTGTSPTTKLFAGLTLSVVLVSESMFGNNGLGRLLWDSILSRDAPLLMSSAILVAFLLAFTIFVLDVISPFVKSYIERSGPRAAIPDTGDDASRLADVHVEVESHLFNRPSTGVRSFARSFLKLPFGMLALFILVGLVALAAVSPLISTVENPLTDREPNQLGSEQFWRNPHPPSISPSPVSGITHPFGTDDSGRDVFSLTLVGTRGALATAALLVTLALAAGSFTWFLAVNVARVDEVVRRLLAGAASLAADLALAVPVFLVAFSSYWTANDPSGYAVLSWALIWTTFLSIAITVKSAKMPRNSHSLISTRSNTKGTFLKTVPSTLYVAKFVAVGGFLAVFAISSIGLTNPTNSLNLWWADEIGRAWEFGAAISGAWWTVLFPAVFVLLLLGSLYIFLDSLETVARNRWGTLLSASRSAEQTPT